MSIATVYSRAITGIDAPVVTIEVHISNGLPSLSIVGMLETAVKESKDRVRSALLNSQFNFPQQQITINLAPADLPKEGVRFDLPIALGILAASNQLPLSSLANKEFIGELGLTGELRAVRGVLPSILAATQANNELVLPLGNVDEAALIAGATSYGASHLLEVCAHLFGQQRLSMSVNEQKKPEVHYPDLADVRGQPYARRALETATVHSISAQGFKTEQWRQRRFHSPHHTASAVAMVGGGSQPRPGEISLAHNGVLFLDELPEFDRKVLEVLREPIESGKITISRASNQAEFPARFQLIAAMNPCPCGYLGEARCHCTEDQVRRYRAKVSGPLMDRIDMLVEVPPVAKSMLRPAQDGDKEEDSATVCKRVLQARQRQMERACKANTMLENKELDVFCMLSESNYQLLEPAISRFGLSARAYHRILKVARTIADLANSDRIQTAHLSEAIGYRRLDTRNT
jgi:magnesium chelatase family protein